MSVSEIRSSTETKMKKSLENFQSTLSKIRTGRAHTGLLDHIEVEYYGAMAPLSQVANVNLLDARTLTVQVWEKSMAGLIEKAIRDSDLGLNPQAMGESIRVPMPALTEETRREYTKQAKNEAENARIAVRNIRRDANSDFKDLEKEKEISEDDQRRAEERVQKLTDKTTAAIEAAYQAKEQDLLSI